MNELVQLESGLLGSVEAVEDLSRAENARILVLSDTHGHYDVMEEIIRSFGPGCSALCFAGDGMWDIVQYLENALESDRLREALPPVVSFPAMATATSIVLVCLTKVNCMDRRALDCR
jgi:hypothetical protein